MLRFLFKILDFFSSYSNKFERKIDKFLTKLTPSHNRLATEKTILELMRENLVVFHLWSERRYKGYLYLHRRKRRELYDNAQKIVADFQAFAQKNPVDLDSIHEEISAIHKKEINFRGFESELKYLYQIMRYLHPENGKFVYRASSNFGLLLTNPASQKLVGDCNQIVTLYVYLFGLKFDINSLKVKTPHEHVCLHFRGIDIEATTGEFASYQDTPQIHPLTELAAVNLLDVTDSYAKIHPITPTAMLESSNLAFLISSNKSLVEENLKIAYQRMVNSLLETKKHNLAFEYAQKSRNPKLVQYAAHHAAIHNLNHNNFAAARRFNSHLSDSKLTKTIDRAEGIHLLNNKNYRQALNFFQKIPAPDLAQRAYLGMAIKLQDQLKNVKTVADLRSKSSTLFKMRDYAQKSTDPGMISHVELLIKQAGL